MSETITAPWTGARLDEAEWRYNARQRHLWKQTADTDGDPELIRLGELVDYLRERYQRECNHSCGPVWFNVGGVEPDMHCKNCGLDLG